MTSAAYGWDAIQPKPRMPDVGETINGQAFTIPGGSQAFTVHCGALVGGAVLKLQALDPVGSDQTSTMVWRDVKVFNLSAGGVQALAAIPNSASTTIPTAATGTGVFRFVATGDQSASPINITITISRL